MINLNNELKYLTNITIDKNFDETICNIIKEYVSKVINCQKISEVYTIYNEISELTHIKFPRIAYNLEYNIQESLEALKTKFVVCSIDKILSTRYSYN